MKICLTGASGFLGSNILSSLNRYHEIVTIGRSSRNKIICDVSNEIPHIPPSEMIIHAAGKAHIIPKNRDQAKEFFKVNLDGTKHLLQGLDTCHSLPNTLVFISTVSVYGLEEGFEIDEDQETKGGTPYSDSKIMAELEVRTWGKKRGVSIVILRIPLIAGTNAPGNLGALQTSIRRGYYFRIGNGTARKSMVNASDIARFIPSLVNREGIYNLTDGYHPSLAELDSYIAMKYKKKIRCIPVRLSEMMASVGDKIPGFPINQYRLEKLSKTLTFSDIKARNEIGWTSNPVLQSYEP